MKGESESIQSKSHSQPLKELVRINGVSSEVILTGAGELRWRDGAGVKRCLAVESDVLGFSAEGSSIRIKAFVEELKGIPCSSGVQRRVMKDFVFEMPNEESLILWSATLRDRIDSLGRPRTLFIILNPFGGKRCARKIFHNEVKPLLEAANILYTLQETKHQRHAQEIIHSLDLIKYDGIVCVSGDGVLVEVVNGLLQREDWESAIKVPFGIIPAGTGNGVAKSLLDSAGDFYSVSNATLAIIRGHKRSLDVTTVLQGETKFFSIMMLSWGICADIDIESKKYRWMGSSRIELYSLVRIMKLRKYHGHVYFVPAPGYEACGNPVKQIDQCKGDDEILINDSKVQQCGYQGPVTHFDDSEWRSFDGPFIAVWLNNVPWTCEGLMSAPEAKFSDGYLDAVLVRDCPKSALLSLLLNMSDGSYVKSPYVTYLKVKAFRLEPGQLVGNPSKGGIIDSDGEVIARGEGTYHSQHQQGQGQVRDVMAYGPPIQLNVDKGRATIFSPR